MRGMPEDYSVDWGLNAPDSAGCSLTVGEMNFFTAAEYTSQCT